jgi:hypothetical protein
MNKEIGARARAETRNLSNEKEDWFRVEMCETVEGIGGGDVNSCSWTLANLFICQII